MKKIQTILLILIVYSFLVLPFPNLISAQDKIEEKTTPTTAKFALLVGVNEYIAGVNNLTGTHNDVGLMKDLLIEYGFTETLTKGSAKDFPCGNQTTESRLKTLCSKQATKKAIVETFKNHLIANAKKYKEANNVSPNEGANIVFFYSGHGSFLDDDNGDEADGVDETIVPTDAKWEGDNQIRDDELNALIKELNQYTTNITLIFDNCNSGTATRGVGVKRFISKTKNAGSRGSKGNSKDLKDGYNMGEGYVTISGSLPNELSYEDYFMNPKTKQEQRNGALTYNLVNFIRQNPGATYRDIMNLTKNAVVKLGRSQTPQAEGDLGRQVFGTSQSSGRVPIYAKCEGTGEDGKCSEVEIRKDEVGTEYAVHKIEMEVGTVLGANEGGTIAVYDEKTNDFENDKGKIGTGLITYSDAFYSEAEVKFSSDEIKKFPQNARIVLLSPNFSTAKRKVALDFTTSLSTNDAKSATDTGIKILNDLSESLKNNRNFETIKESKLLSKLNTNSQKDKPIKTAWDLAVVRATYKDFLIGQERSLAKGNKVPSDNEEVFFISDKNGNPMYGFFVLVNDSSATRIIKDALEQIAHIENLQMLSNTSSSLNKEVEVEFVRVKDVARLSDTCVFTPYPDEERVKDQKGTPQIKIAKRAGRKLDGDAFYFRIKNNSEKELYIYIYSLDATGAIKLIHKSMDKTDYLAPKKELNTHGKDKCGITFFGADSSFGKETIKMLFTNVEIPATILERGSMKATPRESEKSLLSAMLEDAISKQPTSRNIEKFGGSVGGWTAFNFDYEIIQ